jgi:aspartyl-tRNA(Asn)/glutamyl-tRNA(Gln) amidotransferase subunit A
MASYAKTRRSGFGEEVRRRILLGSYVLSESAYDDHFVQAQKIRRLVQQDFNQCFRKPHPILNSKPKDTGVDVLLTPCNITTAPQPNQLSSTIDTYLNDIMTVPASLAGKSL